MAEEDKVNCETSLCIPSIDIFDFEDDKDKIDTGNGSELTVDEGSPSVLLYLPHSFDILYLNYEP